MAALQILALDTATPRIRAPATGDTYSAIRSIDVTPEAGTAAFTINGDVALFRDAADTLAQRRGTNAQTLRLYTSFTDASNGDWLQIEPFNSITGRALISTRANGTGTTRDLSFGTGTQTRLIISNATGNILFNTNLIASSDNAFDIGASGANRPRNLFMASWLRMATTTVASLPAAATAGAGARMFVTDALAPTFGSAVAAGGAVTTPVFSTGSAWNVG